MIEIISNDQLASFAEIFIVQSSNSHLKDKKKMAGLNFFLPPNAPKAFLIVWFIIFYLSLSFRSFRRHFWQKAVSLLLFTIFPVEIILILEVFSKKMCPLKFDSCFMFEFKSLNPLPNQFLKEK